MATASLQPRARAWCVARRVALGLLVGAWAQQAAAQAPAWPEPDKSFGAHALATQCQLTPSGPRLLVKGEFNQETKEEPGAAARFKAGFDKCIDRGDGRTIQVWFWSPGGSVIEGLEVGRLLADAGDRVTTYVPAGKQCVSICTVAFLGGAPRRRFVHPTAQYVVHAFGSRGLSRSFAGMVFETLVQAQDWVRCFDAGDNKGACEKLRPPDGDATEAIVFLLKQMQEKNQPVRPLATVCSSKALLDLYKSTGMAGADDLVKRPCAYQMAVTSSTLQSWAVNNQRDTAQTTRLLYQYLTSPPKGVHVERLLDRWFSVTINNTVPLTRAEIADIGVAGILDLEQPAPAR